MTAASRNALAIEVRVSYAATAAKLVNCADALPKMDSVQEHHERRLGDQLIEWAIVQVMRDAARYRAQRAHPFLLDDLLPRVA